MTEHHGQHARCRACGTNDRAVGTNPRGLRPPDPPVVEAFEPTPPPLDVWAGPELDPTAGPLIDDPTEKLTAARQALAATRKPEMGPPPATTRGAVHR